MNMRWIFLTGLLAISCASWGAHPFDGTWKLNLEETDKVAVKYEEGSGVGKKNALNNVNVSVGGLPLPGRSRVPPQSNLRSKDPAVMSGIRRTNVLFV